MHVAAVIRDERPDEWPNIRALIDRAFAPHQAAGQLADWLHERAPALSLVAEVDGALAGQVMFSPLPLHTADGRVDVLCLAPLAVDEPYRRRGIGRSLVRHGLSQLTDRPEPLVVLEGDPALYAPLGFRSASELGIARPSDLIPEAAFQAVPLPAYRTGLSGWIEYPEYFYEIGAVGPP